MKILFLAPQPYFSNRGTPLNVRAMLTTLTAAGLEVDLVTYPLGEDTPLPGLTIHRVSRPPLVRRVPIGPSLAKLPLDAAMGWTAWSLARRGKYRLVHAVEESVYLGLALKKMFGLPLIYDMDSSLAEQLKDYGLAPVPPLRWFYERMERMAITRSDLVITVCRHLTDLVGAADAKKPVFQIEDVPLDAGPDETPPDADELDRRMAGRKVLLYTGNFEPYQGVQLAVEALPTLLVRHPEALLVLVGGKGEALKAMRTRAARRGVEGAVLMIEPRPPAQMGWFMGRSAGLISPRMTGGNTPFKIYTYLQSGRPVVATRLPTHTQVLDDTVAILVEPDAAALAAGLAGLLDDPARAESLGAAGRRLVEERYSLPQFRRKLLEAYRFLGVAV